MEHKIKLYRFFDDFLVITSRTIYFHGDKATVCFDRQAVASHMPNGLSVGFVLLGVSLQGISCSAACSLSPHYWHAMMNWACHGSYVVLTSLGLRRLMQAHSWPLDAVWWMEKALHVIWKLNKLLQSRDIFEFDGCLETRFLKTHIQTWGIGKETETFIKLRQTRQQELRRIKVNHTGKHQITEKMWIEKNPNKRTRQTYNNNYKRKKKQSKQQTVTQDHDIIPWKMTILSWVGRKWSERKENAKYIYKQNTFEA